MPYRVIRPFQGDHQWQAGEVVSDEQFETWPHGAKLIGRYLTPIKGVPVAIDNEPPSEGARRRKDS